MRRGQLLGHNDVVWNSKRPSPRLHDFSTSAAKQVAAFTGRHGCEEQKKEGEKRPNDVVKLAKTARPPFRDAISALVVNAITYNLRE